MKCEISTDEVIIKIERLQELEKAAEFLEALEAAGVDNWDGYDYAIDILNGVE